MDSLVKPIKDLQGKAQAIMNEHRNKVDSMPDFSIFNDEQQREMKENYLSKIKKETSAKLDEIIFHSELNESNLKRDMNKIKYPFESQAVGSDDRLKLELTKQRAENLALQKLDWNVLKFLDNEISKNEIDFISYFQNAFPLNNSIENDLRAEINSKLSEVEKAIGLNEKNIQLQMCNVLKKEADTFKQITEDDNPALKIQTGTYSNELNQLTKQLETV